MTNKQFIFKFFIFLFGSFLIVSSINFVVDPLYTFTFSQRFNIKKKDFNERVQKTNYLAYIDNNFDSILLGNSRATYINTLKIDKSIGGKVFNYAVNAMSVNEYAIVIQNFIHFTGKQPKVIFIAIDPFDFSNDKGENLKKALLNSFDKVYPYKNLLSLDLFKISLQNILITYRFNNNILDKKQRYYNKNLVKGFSKENKISNERGILGYANLNLHINQEVNLNLLKQLKFKYNQSQFIIFTMPVHKVILEKFLYNEGYISWLKSLINIFYTINHYMYLNDISKSYYTFFDAFHFYPYVGDKIVENLTHLPTVFSNSDFGIELNKDNINNFKSYSKEKEQN